MGGHAGGLLNNPEKSDTAIVSKVPRKVLPFALWSILSDD